MVRPIRAGPHAATDHLPIRGVVHKGGADAADAVAPYDAGDRTSAVCGAPFASYLQRRDNEYGRVIRDADILAE